MANNKKNTRHLFSITVLASATLATVPAFAQEQNSEATKAATVNRSNTGTTDLFFFPVANHDKAKILSAASKLRLRHNLPDCEETDESLIALFEQISKMPESESHEDRIDMGVLSDYRPVADFILGRMVVGLSTESKAQPPKYEPWWQKSHFKSPKLRSHH